MNTRHKLEPKNTDNTPAAVSLLVNDAHGVYVPQVFFKNYDTDLWSGIDPDNVKIIEEGPEHEYYWEAWDEVLASARYTLGGHTWTLWQDGNLFAVCGDLLTDVEYKCFFGEKRT